MLVQQGPRITTDQLPAAPYLSGATSQTPLSFDLVPVGRGLRTDPTRLPNAELLQGDAPPSYESVVYYASAPPPPPPPALESNRLPMQRDSATTDQPPPLGFDITTDSSELNTEPANSPNTERANSPNTEPANLPNTELAQTDAPPTYYDNVAQNLSAPPTSLESNQPPPDTTFRLAELELVTLRQEREIQELRQQLEQGQLTQPETLE